MGMNPNLYYNPNAPGGFFGLLDATGTNVILEWSNTPGAVNFMIQRGVLNTNTGNYNYTSFIVSSNATEFEDFGAINNNNASNDVYNLQAVYPGGYLSATDTWQVLGYAGYNWGAPPAPGDFYAYVDSTGTNVLLSWTPVDASVTNLFVRRGVFNYATGVYDYSTIASVSVSTTNFYIVGAITNETSWAIFSNRGSLSRWHSIPARLGIHASWNAYCGRPRRWSRRARQFLRQADSTGTNVYLSWSPSPEP